jgi:osmoprotectant transport system permease protein
MKAAPALLLIAVAHHVAAEINVGSKRFTESYVLGEIATKVLRNEGLAAEHRQGMGGTIILWEALKGGAISAYPEYTGTVPSGVSLPARSRPASSLGAERARAHVGRKAHDGA